MAASGEIQRPPMGSFPWPPSRVTGERSVHLAINDHMTASTLGAEAAVLKEKLLKHSESRQAIPW